MSEAAEDGPVHQTDDVGARSDAPGLSESPAAATADDRSPARALPPAPSTASRRQAAARPMHGADGAAATAPVLAVGLQPADWPLAEDLNVHGLTRRLGGIGLSTDGGRDELVARYTIARSTAVAMLGSFASQQEQAKRQLQDAADTAQEASRAATASAAMASTTASALTSTRFQFARSCGLTKAPSATCSMYGCSAVGMVVML